MTTTAAGSESSSSSSSSPAAAALPVGFRFRPTDEELVRHYLKAKIAGRAHPDLLAIPDVDLAAVEPWDLPARSVIKSDDPEWFFFARRDRPKYPGKSSRSCRSTAAGYWKATGKDRLIRAPGPGGCRGKGALIGVKKTLVFHRGRAPRGARTPWIMHEYTATTADPQSQSQSLSQSQSAAGPQNDSFVLYRLFNKQDEETPAPVSDPPSTSPPANPLLHADDDTATASASMVEDKASPSDSSQLTPTNVATDHSSMAHLLAAAGDAEQTSDQEASLLIEMDKLPDLQAEQQRYHDEFPRFDSPMRPYTDFPFIGNMGDEQQDLSMYPDGIINEQDLQDMLLNSTAYDETGASNPTGSWTPYPEHLLDSMLEPGRSDMVINSIGQDMGSMGAAPWTQQQQQPTTPAELLDMQQGTAARRIRLAYAIEMTKSSMPRLLASQSESGDAAESCCSTASWSSNHEEEDHVNDAASQTMAGVVMHIQDRGHDMAPTDEALVSSVEVADKLQHLSINNNGNSILGQQRAHDGLLHAEQQHADNILWCKPAPGAGLKQRLKQEDSGRNGHEVVVHKSDCMPRQESASETKRRSTGSAVWSLWLALLVMAPLLLVLVGVWRSLN